MFFAAFIYALSDTYVSITSNSSLHRSPTNVPGCSSSPGLRVCHLSPIFWLVNKKLLIIKIESQSEKRYNKMVDRIRWDPTVSYLPFYYIFFQIDFQFLLLTIFYLQAKILAINDILSNLGSSCTTVK